MWHAPVTESPSTSDSTDGSPPRHSGRLRSPQELADYLEVPVKTIYSWRHCNKGPRGFRVGKHLRFRWGDVEAWFSSLMAEKG